jgi:hypothetical protein
MIKKTAKKKQETIKEGIHHRVLKVLSVLIGFSEALVIYIASSYFKEVSGRSDVGIFYIVIYAIFLVILLNLHKLIRLVGKTRVLVWSFVGQIGVILALLFVDVTVVKVASMILFLLFDQMLLVSLDILLDSCTSTEATGRTRGSHLMILNIGFIVGPFVSTWLLASFNFVSVFSLVLVFKLIALSIAFFRLGQINHVNLSRETVGGLLLKAIKNVDVRRIYYISFALEVFYGLMIMYSPIYLESIGMSLRQIGLVFTIMLIPFLLVEYPVGWIADKELGEKEMIIFFLSLIALTTAWVYYLDKPIVWLWAIGLFATRIGAASLEVLRDSYFYKKIGDDDVDLIDFFRTARPVAYITAALLSVFVVEIYSVHEMFLLASLVLVSALFPAWRLRDNLSEREILMNQHLPTNLEFRGQIKEIE